MKTFFQIVGCSLVHLFLLATCFTLGIVVQGGFLPEVDISATARVVSAICGGVVMLLAYPAIFVLNMIPDPVPNLLEWAIIALNSLLFGTVVVIIINGMKAFGRHGRKNPELGGQDT